MKKFEKFEANMVEKFNSLSRQFSTADDETEKAIIRGKLIAIKDILKEYADVQKMNIWWDYDENNVMKIGIIKA